MSISFYDTSIGTYRRMLDSVAGIMDKGAIFAADNDLELSEIVSKRLRDDMMPFHFQVVSVCHHSWGAVQGMRDGHFSTPSFKLDKNYTQLQAMIGDAREGIASISESDAEDMADKSLVFLVGERELPFTNQNFLLSFSLPNFYFHATTVYTMLRETGVPLGKLDFLGKMKIGL